MAGPDERQQIRDAMDRLLTGAALRSNGALTIVALAEEAGLKRHHLTHRHTDLKDEFNARVRQQGHVPANEVALRAKLHTLEDRVVRLRADLASAEDHVSQLRRMNNVLAVENLAYRDLLAGHTSARPIREYPNASRTAEQLHPGSTQGAAAPVAVPSATKETS